MKESSKVEKTCENFYDFFEDFCEDLTDLTNHKIPNMVRSYQLHTSQKNIVIVRGPFVRSSNPADHKENISSTTYVIFGGIAARILQLGYCNNLNNKNLCINDLIKVVEQLFLQEEETNPDKQNALEQVAYAIMAKAASNSSNNLLRKDIAEYFFYSKKLNRKLSEQEKEKILSDMGLATYSKMTPLQPSDMLELSSKFARWSGQVPHWPEVLPDLDAAFGKIRDEEKTPLEAQLEAPPKKPLEFFFRNEKEMLQQIKKEKEEELEEIREKLLATIATTDTDHDLIIDQNYYNFSGEYDAGDQPQWSLKIFKSFEDWEISLDLKN